MKSLAYWHAAVIAAFVVFAGSMAAKADKLTEANMTRRDYDHITETRSSVEGQPAAAKPAPVHDFSAANEQAVTDAHGVKVIRGRDWKRLSPEERDQRLRDLDKTMQPDTVFVIEVPSGDVWIIELAHFQALQRDEIVRLWTPEQYARLPAAVPGNSGHKQEDRRSDKITLGTSFVF